MQDNTPAHAAASTMEETSQRLIQSIFWPTISPDLKPIEFVWDRVKNYIQRHYPNLSSGMRCTRDSLCKIVR
ncbi:Bgt-51324 [Blumeria graminis f. sp. tritici]|uniref:Bgt-51324 n=1 Tax=Blumeria graminis f. sp. tritici TaxID=62690 RepID=A0A9X9MKF6_BLUGR|nr:Bgt-51324 [Blumeria graminis f. sp. tritici]